MHGFLGGHLDAMDTLPFDVYDSVPLTSIVDNHGAKDPSDVEPVDEILRAPTLKLGDPVDETGPPGAEPGEPVGVADVPTPALENVEDKQSGAACIDSGTPGFDAMNHQAHDWSILSDKGPYYLLYIIIYIYYIHSLTSSIFQHKFQFHLRSVSPLQFSLYFPPSLQEPTSRIEQFATKAPQDPDGEDKKPTRGRGKGRKPGRPKGSGARPKATPKAKAKAKAKAAASKPKGKSKTKAACKSKSKDKTKAAGKAKSKASPRSKVKDSQEGEEMSPQKTPPQRISRDAGEHSEPKVEAPPGRKRSAPATKGDAKVAKVRAAKGEAASFARRNPPTTTRPLAEWTAIKNAFRSKLDDFPHRYKNEDCIPIKQMFLNLPVEIVFFQRPFVTKTW